MAFREFLPMLTNSAPALLHGGQVYEKSNRNLLAFRAPLLSHLHGEPGAILDAHGRDLHPRYFAG
jgi:hypothetical protein